FTPPRFSLFILFAVCFCISSALLSYGADSTSHVRLVGDSTMADKPLEKPNPERGWGQLFPRFFKNLAVVVNYAKNGRSTKSFIDEGLWQKTFDDLQPGDFVIIEFGHNDEKTEDPKRFTDPATTFRENLKRFIRESRAKGAFPILATPINRRNFDKENRLVDTHGAYPDAIRAVATEEKVPLLDLHHDTRPFLEKLGPEESKKFFVWVEPGQYEIIPEGRHDNTHLNEAGAIAVGEIVVKEIRDEKIPLAKWLK
ncbi:MAG TPA: rhamnogalacturonan acetylesterase, partial [Opitutaceae bacterium]|nr:rhamnogalacturonan acetylesterase [Opitutaceae bacterium]